MKEGSYNVDGNAHTSGVHLNTLIVIRWVAIFGQSLAIVIVHFYLEYDMNLPLTFSVVAVSLGYNLLLYSKRAPHQRLEENEARAQLLFDQIQLGVLLYLTGGLINPFVILLLVPTSVSAALLLERSTYQILGISLVILLAEMMTPFPLPWHGAPPVLPYTLMQGTGLAIGFAMVFTTLYMARIAKERRRQEQALSALTIALNNEQKLSALGAMAAATAHELGTPLGTILLIASEMDEESPSDGRFAKDIKDLRTEAQRCGTILSSLSKTNDDKPEYFAWQTLEALAREAAEPHENRGVVFSYIRQGGEQPMIRRSAEAIKSLRNIMENAAGFARSEVQIKFLWDDSSVSIIVSDDGPGFSSSILKKLGEPYVTTRKPVPGRDGGMGLGLFISKTLIELTSGALIFTNGEQGGAKITIQWDRAKLDKPDNNIWNNS